MKTLRKKGKWGIAASLSILAGMAGLALYLNQTALAAPGDPKAVAVPAKAPDTSSPPPMMDPVKLFTQIDANNDGTISKEEFLAFHAKNHPPHGAGEVPGHPADGQASGAKKDATPPPVINSPLSKANGPDHSGLVLSGVHESIPVGPMVDPGKLFDTIDTGHKGTITRDEYIAFRNAHRPAAAPSGAQPDKNAPPAK